MYLSAYFAHLAPVAKLILSDSESQGISVDLGGLTEKPWLFLWQNEVGGPPSLFLDKASLA
jgi:hypothetical protein